MLALIVTLSLITSAPAQTKNVLDTIAPLQKTATVALVVTDLKNPTTPLLSLNDSIYLQPASTMKIFTSIIATESLDHSIPFKTQLTGFGKQDHSLFTGDIHLEVGANPSFDNDALDRLFTALKLKKIDRIKGNIILLKTHFDNIEHIPGLVWDELDECYATKISDVSFNKNCFIATLQNIGGKIRMNWPQKSQPIQLAIQLADDCHDETISNTHFPAYGYGIHLKQNPFLKPETLRGCWSKQLNYIQLKRSVHQPEQALSIAIKNMLEKHKITLSGNIHTRENRPQIHTKKAWQLTENSPSLYQLIGKMIKKSDNHIAAHLFRESAYQRYKQRTSWEDAQQHGQQMLSRYQLADDDASIVDGAGLSRNNRIQAKQLQNSLITIFKTKKLYNLIDTFPHQNIIDSTLSKRLANIKTPVYAKTGNLKGVMSLAGFIDPYGKHPKAFTIIINGNKSVGRDYLELESDLIQQMIDL